MYTYVCIPDLGVAFFLIGEFSPSPARGDDLPVMLRLGGMTWNDPRDSCNVNPGLINPVYGWLIGGDTIKKYWMK